MEKEVIVLKCQDCGEEFLYEFGGRGAKPKLCEKCKVQHYAQSKKKYNAKQKDVANKETNATNSEYVDFVDRVANKLIQLDNIRVDLCELAKQMNEYQSSYDKNDQMYLHKLESLDVNDVSETTKMVREWKQSRNGRRNVKDLLILVGNTIDTIPYKNYTNALPILKGSSFKR